MAAYTVTENTSVVLISTLSTTPKIVYLSSISYPGHIVTIKDISGVVNQGSPVVVSTARGLSFVDGSISTLLLDPYSFVTVASKTPTTWQILNNFGFLTTLSNAYIQQLTGSAAFVKTLSTQKDYVSTTFANTVTVTKDLQLLGDVAILGNITVGGVVDLFSTLSVKENIGFSTNFTVNGSVTFASTLFIRDEFTVGNVSTLQSLSVKDSLSVNTILDVSSINFKPNSNVQNVSMSSIFISTNFQTAQGISSLNRTIVSNSVSTLSSFISLSSMFINETTRIDGYLDVAKNFQTNSMRSFSSGVVQREASISSLSLRGVLSTADSLFVRDSLLAKEQTNVNDVLVNGDVTTSSLIVTGNVFVSSIFLTGEMKIGQDSLLFSSLHTSTLLTGPFFALGNISVRAHTSVSSFFSTLTDMNIGGVLTAKGDLRAKQESGVVGSISNILSYIQPQNFSTGNLYVSTNLAIADDFSIPGKAKADILAAPIRIELSTLTLSNAMNVMREASIPILQSTSNYEGFFPNTILAGQNIQENTNRSPFFLNVNQEANIRNLLQFKSPSFAGEISSIRASSITSTNTLKTFLIGSELPDSGGQYFIANIETRFETSISSAFMTVSSIRASSIQAEYFVGDASQLTNANSFTDKLGVSSLSAKILEVGETLTFFGSTTANTFTVGNRGILYQTDFLSTINTWVATGVSFEQNTMTQYTQNIRDWKPTSNTTFEFFGSAIAGNSNTFNPFFVATGGDSRAEHTIQYSVNGYDWFNVQSGGFEDSDESGVKKGNTVTYLRYLSTTQIRNRWLVGGRQNTIASTIFYSDDGSNFFAVPDLQFITDSNLGSNSIQKIKSADLHAVGLTDLGKFIHSSNGYIWQAGQYLSGSVPPFQAFGYGYFSNPPNSPPGNYWAAIDSNTNLWYLLPGYTTLNWQPTGSLTGLFGLIDMAYSPIGATNGYWLGITANQLYYTSTLTSWTPLGGITGPLLQSIAFDTAQERWFIGATSPQAQQTLWTSVNGSNWNAIQSGGFSTGIASYGQGNALLVVNDTITLGAGTGAFSFVTRTRPQILQIIDATQPPTPSGAYTTTKLSASNASNVFLRSVYGLGYESSLEYPYVAVGDGITPQKTIARSSNLTNWIPATTGGFSTAYGVLYYSPSTIWLATGSAVASTATIQYSQDAGSWFPTNFSGVGSFSGRAIAKMNDTHPDFPDRLLAGGEGENGSNLLYSESGFTWQTVTAAPSLDTIYGLGAGIIVTSGGESNEGMVAVGSRGNTGRTMSYSTDGLTWTSATGFQFEVAAYGVACGSDLNGDLLWIAVGQSSNPGGPTIAYSPNGRSWSSLDFSLGGFFYAGYSVVYNPHSNVFIATGRDEFNTYSIQYSGDGVTWNLLAGTPTTNGFLSQQIIGTANSVFGQQILNFEREPFITMPKFIAYERPAPLNYTQASLRVLSTSMILNEALAINLSSQIILNSNLPFDSVTTVTVEGDVSTVNLIYKGSEPTYYNLLVSSMTFSTIEVKHVMEANVFTTPSYDFFIGKRANVISTTTAGSLGDATTIVNDVLTVSQQGLNVLYPYVRISTNTKPIVDAQAGRLYSELDVGGITATSTVSLSVHKQPIVQFQEPNQLYISTAYLSIFEGSNPRRIVGKNTIYSQASTISFNSALTINQSTQRVGVFTSNPLFDFDMRRAGWISNLAGGGIRTETVFFTIQSI